MSLVLCGPRRVYVLLVLWERLADGCGACPRALSSGTRVRVLWKRLTWWDGSSD